VQIIKQLYNGDYEPVDLFAARLKCLGAQWMLQVCEHLRNKPQIIVIGFCHAGVYSALDCWMKVTKICNIDLIG